MDRFFKQKSKRMIFSDMILSLCCRTLSEAVLSITVSTYRPTCNTATQFALCEMQVVTIPSHTNFTY